MLSLLRQAFNSWKNAKGVALLAILALALGIGSATAIYTVVHTVLLKPLPYREGNRFVGVFGARKSEPDRISGFSDQFAREFQKRNHSFDVFGWFAYFSDFNLSSPGEPQHVNGLRVTPSLVNGLGVNLRMGRWFQDAAHEAGNYNLAVLSYALWEKLGSPGNIVGQSIVLDKHSYTVTGVAPPWFQFPLGDLAGMHGGSDLWIPIDPGFVKDVGDSGLFICFARMRPGVTFAQALADVQRIAAQLVKEYPNVRGSDTATLRSLRETVVRDIRPTLLLLLAAAGLLLLITCANVSGLLVTRAITRARETAIRLALGAAQTQLIAQYFFEGLVVSLIGAALGVVLSYVVLHAILSLAANYIPLANEISVDGTALAFAAGVAFLASLLTSLAPLWQALRTSPNAVLTEGVRASASAQSKRLSQGLVIAEIALAFTLLCASALLIHQLSAWNEIRPGFDPNNLLTFQLTTNDPAYNDTPKLVAYQNRLTAALEAIPGVTGVGFASHLPLEGCCFGSTFFAEGRTLPPNASPDINFQIVDSNYLSVMRIPVLAGRALTGRDVNGDIGSTLLNRTAAKYFFGEAYPIGRYGHFDSPSGGRVRVVGIVGDVRNNGFDNPTKPEAYISSAALDTNPMHFVVRSQVPERVLVPEIRQAVHRVNPSQPIYEVRSMRTTAAESLSLQRATSLLTTFFALAALVLASLGVYGVVAYSVRQRTVEFGTRMALGAVGRDLLRLVMGNGLTMAIGGLILGALAVAATTTILVKSSVIHSVAPLPFVYSSFAIAAIALLASFYPAWRATQLSPMVAIRNEPETMWLQTRERLRRAANEVSELLSRDKPAPAVSEAFLLAGFVDATRQAESVEKALEAALSKLAEALRAESAWLLEKISDSAFRIAAEFPAQGQHSLLQEVPPHGFLVRRLHSYSLPLPLTENDLVSWKRWAAEYKPQVFPELQALDEAKVRLAIALRTTKETIGLLLLGPTVNGEEYSAATRRALRVCADQFALMLENGRLTDRMVEQEKLRRDLALATEVQRRLLPDNFPESSLGELAAFTLPARSVGGDYYDFVKVGDQNIGIALADVAGKGVAAALIMSVVQASLRILTDEGKVSLPELVAKMNRFLHRSTGFNSYATFFYAQMDEQTRQLSYVNAGHNPPYLLRASGVEELSTGGMVIGMFAAASYEEGKVDLHSGDVLVAFTDGVTEALNLGEEEFGEERLKELLKSVTHLPVDEMATRITASLREWIGEAPQHDDMTFLVMKVK
ncbi:MAG TPA: ADOP family duplicated permease [Bryobacteraceae bacterium]|nr:ADOP family duplicated permease [Bryobacteraceae bacterium]